jgi:hypothetical protein
MLTGITFGLIPGRLPVLFDFKYSINESGTATNYIHSMRGYVSVSIWDHLSKIDDTSALAEALGNSQRIIVEEDGLYNSEFDLP